MNYAEMCEHARKLTNDEVIELIDAYRDGDREARDEIIMNYLPLILKHAHRYANKQMDPEELVADGIIALDRVIEKYVETPRTPEQRFFNYANSAISNQMMDSDLFDRHVTFPANIKELRRKIYVAKQKFYDQLLEAEEEFREPTLEEISDIGGIEYTHLRNFFMGHKAYFKTQITVGEIDEDGNVLEIPVEDKELQYIENKDLYRKLEKNIDFILSHLDAKIIKYSYGLFGYDQLSLKEIKSRMRLGITIAAISYRRKQAINTLRFELEDRMGLKLDFFPNS